MMRSPKSVEGMWQGRTTGPRRSGMDEEIRRGQTDGTDMEDREDRRSGVPEYLRTKTAGLGLVIDGLERVLE
jgi:hypothetical protein